MGLGERLGDGARVERSDSCADTALTRFLYTPDPSESSRIRSRIFFNSRVTKLVSETVIRSLLRGDTHEEDSHSPATKQNKTKRTIFGSSKAILSIDILAKALAPHLCAAGAAPHCATTGHWRCVVCWLHPLVGPRGGFQPTNLKHTVKTILLFLTERR